MEVTHKMYPAEMEIDQMSFPPVPMTSGGPRGNGNNQLSSKSKSTRMLKVVGTGEIVLDPDTIEFVVRLESAKESFTEVNASISKRVNYLQELAKSLHIKNTTVHKSLKKDEKNFHMTAEISMTCNSMTKYEKVHLTAIEKFSALATVSDPILTNSPKQLETARLTALKMAKDEACKKAEEMVSGSNQDLGSVVLMQSQGEVQSMASTYEDQAHDAKGGFRTFNMHKKKKMISSSIVMVYELVPRVT